MHTHTYNIFIYIFNQAFDKMKITLIQKTKPLYETIPIIYSIAPHI